MRQKQNKNGGRARIFMELPGDMFLLNRGPPPLLDHRSCKGGVITVLDHPPLHRVFCIGWGIYFRTLEHTKSIVTNMLIAL